MTTDATQVTGSPLADGVARPGDVLAERYELLEVLDSDGPSVGYRAIDQETERSVLVRVLAGPGLPESALGEVLERLRGLVGVGGRYLSSLLDADREGRRPFTVEAWPAGTQLSAIFEARRVREDRLGAREVLPVISRVSAGLAALPPPWHHGDVRAERVWVDTEGVRLTGAFMLAALPPPILERCLEALGPGVSAYAPEVASGRSSASADRWGLAAIAWEALTGRPPDVASEPPELSGPLLIALRRLLDTQPGRRPKDLKGLIEALARQAGLPVPRIDAEPHRRPAAPSAHAPTPIAASGGVSKAQARTPSPAGPRRATSAIARPVEGAAEDGTQEVSFDQIMEQRAIRRRVEGAAEEGTQEIELDSEDALDPDLVQAALASDDDALDPDLVQAALASADDTARHAPVTTNVIEKEHSEGGLDPRLVRAALGITLEDGPSHDDDALDPRLVRAALGVTSDSSAIEELPSDELEMVGESTAPAARAPQASAPRPRPAHAPTPQPVAKAQTKPAARPAPTPRPRPAPAPLPAPQQPKPAAQPAPQQASTPVGMRAASGEGGGTAIVQRPEETPRPRRRRSPFAGPLIVVGALLLALVIVGLGFLVRSLMTREQDSQERSRHIQERLEQIRNADP